MTGAHFWYAFSIKKIVRLRLHTCRCHIQPSSKKKSSLFIQKNRQSPIRWAKIIQHWMTSGKWSFVVLSGARKFIFQNDYGREGCWKKMDIEEQHPWRWQFGSL